MRVRGGIGFCLIVAVVAVGSTRAARAHPSADRVLRLSLPHINTFYLQPAGESDAKVNTGFWGFGIGLLFRHARGQFLGLSASAVADIGVPVPAAIDYIGEQEFMTAVAVDLTNNHVRGRHSFGYGISYARHRWELEYYDDPTALPPTRDPVVRRSDSLGLVLLAHRALNERFSLGLIYRPSLYRTNAEVGFCYQHVISIELALDLGLP